MDYEVREFDEEGELYFVTHFGDYEQDAWKYAESLAKKGVYAEVHTQSTYEGCTLDLIKEGSWTECHCDNPAVITSEAEEDDWSIEELLEKGY